MDNEGCIRVPSKGEPPEESRFWERYWEAVATMDCLWNDAVPEAGAPMVGSNAGWNEGVCARRLRVV